MSADLPPLLPTETGTPPDEWARSTTTAAFSKPEPAPAVSRGRSSESTPGVEFPGAFPKSQQPRSENQPTTAGTAASDPASKAQAEHGAGIDFGDAASRAVQTVTSTAASTAQYIASYMPSGATQGSPVRASEHDVIHSTSLPSSETMGAGEHEHVGGAGSLPGSVSEESVSRLPDERQMEQDPKAGVADTQQKAEDVNIAGTYPFAPYGPAVGESAGAPAPMMTHETHQHVDVGGTYPSAPYPHATSETTGSAAHKAKGPQPYEQQSGVGIFPGAMSERVHATPPGGAQSMPSQEKGGIKPGEHVSEAGELPGRQGESGVAALPEKRAEEQRGQSESTTGKVTENTKETARKAVTSAGHKEGKAEGYDTDYHPAELHPDTRGPAAGGAGAAAGGVKGESAVPESTEAPKQDTSALPQVQACHAEKAKKVGFMEKMRGEAKILLGKVEGKKGEAKVEEGKRVKAGEA
ncbi:hypothetical protein BKA93DRAFT_762462 [Sparassis latifolia]